MSLDLQPAPPETDPALGVEAGVIEEARRRRNARRRAAVVSLSLLVVLGAIVAALVNAGPTARPQRAGGARPGLARDGAGRAGAARIAPALTGGSYGWSVMAGRGGSCCTVPVRGNPLGAETTTDTRPGYEMATFLSGPEIAGVSFEGRSLPTRIVHLPFGLRLVQVTISHPRGSSWPGPGAMWPAVRLTAVDSRGRALPKARFFDGPGVSARWWKRPRQPERGPCSLQPHGLPSLTPQWGHVASAILPYGAAISGRAFFSCIDTEYYVHRWPLDAAILLDAAHPGRAPAPIPEMTAVRGAPGYFNVPATWNGAITARRVGAAWVVIAGGSGAAQRLEVLRHLTANVSLPRRDAGSS